MKTKMGDDGRRGSPYDVKLVAIVDDDALVRQGLAEGLGDDLLQTAAFASPEEFLKSGIVGDTDCLLLDIHIGESYFRFQEYPFKKDDEDDEDGKDHDTWKPDLPPPVPRDLPLPPMLSTALFRFMTKHRRHVTLIITAALMTPEREKELLDNGAIAVLVKPFSLLLLKAVVNKAFGRG